MPKAPEVIGISNIKEGKRFYEQRAKYYTTLDITPEEIFKTGQAEVKRIRGEMEAIIKELKFEDCFRCDYSDRSNSQTKPRVDYQEYSVPI